MRLFCRENHWFVIKGQLILATPRAVDTERSRQIVEVLEKQIRQRIYTEIMAIQIEGNRQSIVKYGIEMSLLKVKAMCAQVALNGGLADTLER